MPEDVHGDDDQSGNDRLGSAKSSKKSLFRRIMVPKWLKLGMFISVIAGLTTIYDSQGFKGLFLGVSNYIAPFDVDHDCRPLASDMEQKVCVAFRQCDSLAGHPLDPDRRYSGWTRGASLQTLKNQLADSDRTCSAIVTPSPSARIDYMLFRIYDAQGRQKEAVAALNRSAAAEYPMARFQAAARLLWQSKDPVSAVAALERMANLTHAPPEALITLGELKSCGIGTSTDLNGARESLNRAVDELKLYVWAPYALSDAQARREQIMRVKPNERPQLCQEYDQKLKT